MKAAPTAPEEANLTPMKPPRHPESASSNPSPSLPRAAATAVALVLLAVVWTGCEVPVSRQPIGSTPIPLQNSPLSGVWNDAEGRTWHVRVANPAAGQLEVVTVDQENEREFSLQRYEVLLRTEGTATLFNLRPVNTITGGEDPFVFGRGLVTDTAVVLLPANAEALRLRLLDGAFGGEVKTNSNQGSNRYEILVTNRFDRLARELVSPTGWTLLDVEHPWVFTRGTARSTK